MGEHIEKLEKASKMLDLPNTANRKIQFLILVCEHELNKQGLKK